MKKIEWYHALIVFGFFLIASQLILGPLFIFSAMEINNIPLTDMMSFSTSRFGVVLQSSAMFISFVFVPIIYMKLLRKDPKLLLDMISIDLKVLGLSVLGMFAFGFVLDGMSTYILDVFPNYNKSILTLIDPRFQDMLGGDTFHQMIFKLFDTNNILIVMGMILVIGVLPGFGEEFLFRGFMQRVLMNRFHFVGAVILSGGIFGAIHLIQDMSQGVGAFLISFYLGYIYVVSKNLWVPIICHMINNSFSGFTAYLYPDMMQETPQPELLPILIAAPIAYFVYLQLKKIAVNNNISFSPNKPIIDKIEHIGND